LAAEGLAECRDAAGGSWKAKELLTDSASGDANLHCVNHNNIKVTFYANIAF
jgi:hypothetical protein